MTNKHKPKRLVYSLYVANELTKRGFKLLEAQPHKDKPSVLVFWFENRPDFDDTVDIIVKEKRAQIEQGRFAN